MVIDPRLLKQYSAMNEAQREVVGHTEGPLLVIAGPGSGKTYSLVLRTVNLLLLGKAEPSEIVLCTFTEKAAYELRDRLSNVATKVGYQGDLSELRVGTIHGICNQLLLEHRHRAPLGNGYESLDELTQRLFIFDHFDEVLGPDGEPPYLGRWQRKWGAIDGLVEYFNKITEELVDPELLVVDSSPFHQQLGRAYIAYRELLFAENRVDFAHQQRLVHDLLGEPATCERITRGIKYVLVDEYQDTNYVQEQVLTKLAAPGNNLCVVGDEDQSLYRFRGATVRNILEFPDLYPGCRTAKLTTNYRSHKKIVRAYDRWMASHDWSNSRGRPFRYDKTILPDPDTHHTEYPSVISIWGQSPRDEAGRFADLVLYLKAQGVIEDYSQVALLLHSVRSDRSGPYLEALDAKGIPAFCPRARAYFENEEICYMVGCFALIFGYHGEGRGQLQGRALQDLADYVDNALIDLARRYAPPHPLGVTLSEFARDIESLSSVRRTLDMRPADYFYRLIALEPFQGYIKRDQNKAHNLAIFSQLLNAFQNYYHYTVITHRNRESLRYSFFNSFLRLLHSEGMNDYEDPNQPFPKGYVQVMTIHQAKGLEFPVVVVGSLDVQLTTAKGVDRDLQRFYRRPPYEPENRITGFDRMRLHYVAFSRPEKLLVLTADERPKPYFASIWQGRPQWPYVQKELLAAQRFGMKEYMPVKRRYSFTGDLKVYETCPRQYEFFREYDFTPSRSATIFFGLLVHQTIEEIHRIVLDGQLHTLNEDRTRAIFDRTFQFLTLSDVRPPGPAAREAAFQQVMNYFRQNQEEMQRVIETEVDVSLEKEGYILAGKVDLLMGGDGKLELLDFKSSERLAAARDLQTYTRQLSTYAHILERRTGKLPDRLYIYWTAEPLKANALQELPYRPEMVDEAGVYFDSIVQKIQADDFAVIRPPERKVCKDCDMKTYCAQDGLIAPFGRYE